MAIITKRTWETVYFTATKTGGHISQTVELTLNHDTKKFNICTNNQEMVKIDGDDVTAAYLKAQATMAAVKYVMKQFNQ